MVCLGLGFKSGAAGLKALTKQRSNGGHRKIFHFLNVSLFSQTRFLTKNLNPRQCDQIWRLIGLWETFKSLWQQLICPNLPYSLAIFVKMSKSIIFLVKSFLGNFHRHLAIFVWSH